MTFTRAVNIPIEEIARLPLPGMTAPGSIAFSPDGRWVSALHSQNGSLVQKLVVFDTNDGSRLTIDDRTGDGVREDDLSVEEKLRRERLRQYELGLTGYAWLPKGERLLLPLPSGLYIQDGIMGLPKQIANAEGGPLVDPRSSPDGEWVAYVQNGDLFVVSAQGGIPAQITPGSGASGRTYGLAEYIAQEEMDRSRGYWWSADSQYLAFEEVDESHIPIYTIMHQGQDAAGAVELHHYPFAGQANARVRLGVTRREGGPVTWMNLGHEEDIYLARVDWLADGDLVAQVENRSQTRLELLRCNVQTGESRSLLVESNDTWINLHDLFKPLADGRFIWGSERSGYMHLYLYEEDGSNCQPLTSGNWTVLSIAGIDEAHGQVFFTATLDSTLEEHLYRVSLAGGEITRLTDLPGTHSVVLNPKFSQFVDSFNGLSHPPEITLNRLEDGSILYRLYEPDDPRLDALALHPPEMVWLSSRDGERLYGAIFHPPAEFGPGPHPTMIFTYGGPHAQLVGNFWKLTASLRLQHFSRSGYLVFVLDNRGSAHRGLAFESAIYHNMGDLEVRDQVDGVRWLVEQGLADPERVGVMGWSYGGYMALMCLCRAPETFKAAVAGAPVTSWDGYDTHYTERYMGMPQENAQGYQDSAIFPYVKDMQGRLLIIHGLVDENVHFRHTARLINRLIAEQKPYDLLLFPDERHGPRRLADRVYLEENVLRFIEENI